MRAVKFLALLIAAAWSFPAALGGAEGPCDPYLRPQSDDPNGYRLRGDRCEGVYIKEVSAAGVLTVVSFTESFALYDLSSGKDLLLEWPAVGEGPVHLRAYSLRRRLYYRMDTIRPSGSRSYEWPSGMLAVLRLARPEIGLVGSIGQSVGGVRRDVLLPLTVRPRGDGNAPKALELVVYPGVELAEVFLTLAPVEPSGARGRFVLNGEPLRYGYYPADRGVPIRLPELKTRGLHVVEIGATLSSGGSGTTTVWFHSGGS
jgi:hypothetical protein